MKIPAGAIERQRFYAELVRQCLTSRNDRFEFYKQLRNYYLFGSATSEGAPYNKIGSTVETLTSFIYAPDSTKFSIHLGTTAPPDEISKVPPLVHELNDMWRSTKAHLAFSLGIKWSLAFGCMLFKGIWTKGMPRPYLVEPHQFGVLREDVPDLEDQEAFVHCYTTTRTQLESDLEGNPRKAEILARVGVGAGENDSQYPTGVQRLVLSAGISLTAGSSTGGGVANMAGARISYEYSPKVEADLIDMFELYVWNDEEHDYQMVTIAHPDVVIYDRKQTGVPGIPCFVKLAPELNCYDYFWGESFVAKLAYLQDWRTTHSNEIRSLLARQADPPASFTGFGGIADEKMRGMKVPGGQVSSAMPGAKYEVHAPQMPPNMFAVMSEIDRMFDDQAGIGHILQGKGEPGVRSRGQADLMARLGSARPKARAIVIEEACEDLATWMLRSIQENSKERFTAVSEKNPQGTGLIFTPAQFTHDYEVKVDAHSSSPIFVEDRKADAVSLLEARAINRARFLEMVDPPGLQVLLHELKGIEAKEAAAAEREEQREAQGGSKK